MDPFRSLATEQQFADELLVLRCMLASGWHPPALPRWEALEPGTRRGLGAVYLLVDPVEDADAESFFALTLLRLLRQIQHVTERQHVELQGSIRGHVLWPRTYKARSVQGFAPQHYICRQVTPRYDTPENQYLKFVVERLAETIADVPAAFRAGACFYPTQKAPQVLATKRLLSRIEAGLRVFRRHLVMQQVSLPPFLSDQHQLHAEHFKLEEYRHVARLYERLQKWEQAESWDLVTQSAARVLPLPRFSDEADEPWLSLTCAIGRHLVSIQNERKETAF